MESFSLSLPLFLFRFDPKAIELEAISPKVNSELSGRKDHADEIVYLGNETESFFGIRRRSLESTRR